MIYRKVASFVSDQAHYSILSAMAVLGLGSENLVQVPTDKIGAMRVECLVKAIKDTMLSGSVPFFVGATSGTTVLGAFDPLEDIAKICEEYDLWLHVDAAFGGAVLLSPKHRHLMNGIEKADSVTWDAHKVMNVPSLCSTVLLRKQGILQSACTVLDLSDNAKYLFHDKEDSIHDTGRYSLQCGRKVEVLKLWLAWLFYGESGYRKRVGHLFELAAYAEQIVRDHPRLELAAEPQYVTICFRYVCADGVDSDRFHIELRERIKREGMTLFNYASIKGRIVYRLHIVDSDTQKSHIDWFFEYLISEAQKL